MLRYNMEKINEYMDITVIEMAILFESTKKLLINYIK